MLINIVRVINFINVITFIPLYKYVNKCILILEYIILNIRGVEKCIYIFVVQLVFTTL